MRFAPQDRFLTLTPRSVLALVGASVALGTLVYGCAQVSGQRAVRDAYRHGDVICEVLERAPTLNQGVCGGSDSMVNNDPFTARLLHYLLVEAAVIDRDLVPTPAAMLDRRIAPGASFLAAQLLEGDKEAGLEPRIGRGSSLEWAVLLAQAIGGSAVTESPDSLRSRLLDFATGAIAGTQYWDWFGAADVWTTEGRVLFPFVFKPPSRRSDADILEFLFRSTGVIGPTGQSQWFIDEDALKSKTWAAYELEGPSAADSEVRRVAEVVRGTELEPGDRLRVVSSVERFALFLLGRLHSSRDVREAQKWAVIVRGPEQWAMFCILIMVIGFMGVRWRMLHNESKRLGELRQAIETEGAPDLTKLNFSLSSDESAVAHVREILVSQREQPRGDDVASLRSYFELLEERVDTSRWLVRWVSVTLPAIGFVGTVRGILQSLSSADAIVWAATRPERAFAIGELSGELGLAFATTLVALMGGIFVSWLNELQSGAERRWLQRLEETAIMVSDPRYVSDPSSDGIAA